MNKGNIKWDQYRWHCYHCPNWSMSQTKADIHQPYSSAIQLLLHSFHSSNLKNLTESRFVYFLCFIFRSSRLLSSFCNHNSLLPQHNSRKLKKEETTRHLAIVACLCRRHILTVFWFVSAGSEEKEKSEGLSRGGGGWRRGAVKKVFSSLCQTAQGWGSVSLPNVILRTHKARGLGKVGSSSPW